MADKVPEPVDDQSPLQLKLEIHRNGLATIIERMMQKIEIAYCLESLLADNAKLLSHCLSTHNITSIANLSSKMNKSGSMSSMRSATNRIRRTLSMEFRNMHQDLTFSNLVTLLHHDEEIMKKVQELIVMKSPSQLQFLIKMRELQTFILQMLNTTVSQQKAYQEELQTAFVNNEKYKKKNFAMDMSYTYKTNNLTSKINEKDDMTTKFKEQVDITKEKYHHDLHRIVIHSERNLKKTTTKNVEQEEALDEEAKQAASQYHCLLEAHLEHEKTLRVKRSKLQFVLSNWLNKYDEDMFDLQAKINIEEKYEEERIELDDLVDKFDKQAIEYKQLMAEKVVEEARILKYCIHKFRKVRAVRIIQRWWRRILARKARRKGKKRKGKKK